MNPNLLYLWLWYIFSGNKKFTNAGGDNIYQSSKNPELTINTDKYLC